MSPKAESNDPAFLFDFIFGLIYDRGKSKFVAMEKTPTRLELLDKIREIILNDIENVTPTEKDQIKEESFLKNDLNLDSLDEVDLAMKLEAAYPQAKISDSDFSEIETVADLIDRFLQLAAKK
jgi:acyl carrier protein